MSVEFSKTLAALYRHCGSGVRSWPWGVSQLLAVLAAIEECGGEAKASEIAKTAGLSPATAVGAAYELADFGLAFITADGCGLTAGIEASITTSGRALLRRSKADKKGGR